MSGQKYKKQFWIILSLLILFVFIVAGGGIAYLIHYSATGEKVCQQCHPEIIELWKNSNGHPSDSTTCYECHSRGMKIVPADWNVLKHTRDQFVPPEYLADDGLTSQRCLDCHEEVLDWGYQIKKKVIQFNHRIHRQEDLECVDCHRSAGHEYLSGATNRPSIPECLECHIREFNGPPKSQKCLNCHEVMLAPGRTWITAPLGITMEDSEEGQTMSNTE
jgi:hypothetical protein